MLLCNCRFLGRPSFWIQVEVWRIELLPKYSTRFVFQFRFLFSVLTPLLIRGWSPLAAAIHPWWWLQYEEAEKSSASPFCKKKSETRENSSLMKHTAGTRIWGSSDWRFGYRGQCWKYSSEPGHGSYCTWLQVPCSPPWWCCHWKGQSCIWCLTSWISQKPVWFFRSEGLGFRLHLIWIFSAFCIQVLC